LVLPLRSLQLIDWSNDCLIMILVRPHSSKVKGLYLQTAEQFPSVIFLHNYGYQFVCFANCSESLVGSLNLRHLVLNRPTNLIKLSRW
jgi:hypothetical protein